MKAMFLKAKLLSLLGGLLALAQTGAAEFVTCAEIKGAYGSCKIHSSSLSILNSKVSVPLQNRPEGWKTKTLYYAIADAIWPSRFLSAENIDYATKNGFASQVPDSAWSESSGTITCEYSSSSDYAALVICHEPYTYNVVFNSNGGDGSGTTTGMSSLSYTNTTTKLTKNAFTRTGYTFAGWAKTSTGAKAYDDQEAVGGSKFGVTSDGQTINLYAKWNPITYKVSYNEDGGTLGSSAPTSATYDTPFSVSAPTKTGYTFTGWTISGVGTTARYGTSATSCTIPFSDGKLSCTDDPLYFLNLTASDGGTVSFTANWSTTSSSVSFNAGNGSGGPVSQSIPYGTTAKTKSVSPLPTRDGYTFAGYYTATNGGGTKYFDDTGLLVTDWLITDSSITLFAAWSPITYTVTFNSTDGSGTVPSSLTKKYDETFELPSGASLTKSGYKFSGWALTSGGSAVKGAGDEVTVSQYKSWLSGTTLTFYAAWALNTKTVYFSANGGSVSPGSVTVEIGQAIGTLPTPTYSGGKKIFAGWFTAASGGTQVTASTVVTSDLSTLYAHWTNTWYTIRFNGNGSTDGTMDDQTVEFNVSTNLSDNAFQRTGYTFAGWAKTEDAAKVDYADKASITTGLATSANATVDLYAVWTANTYYVEFAPNGGEGTMPKMTNSYDVAFNLPANAFTAPNEFSEFGGWWDAANAKTYAAGATVSNLTAEADATVTLTAVWNSTLSDLSQAMDCTNLVWELSAEALSALWEVCTGVGYNSSSSARQKDSGARNARTMLAFLGESKETIKGTLSFWWKPSGEGAKLAVGLGDATGANTWTTYSATSEAWTKITHAVEASGTVYVYLFNQTTAGDGYAYIDQMTWTTGDAEEHPEPTADDAVTISGLTATDSGFTLSYTGNAKFAYRVLYKDSLASPIAWLPYGSLTNDTGASGAQTFTLDRDASVPMRFFKVETIRRP